MSKNKNDWNYSGRSSNRNNFDPDNADRPRNIRNTLGGNDNSSDAPLIPQD